MLSIICPLRDEEDSVQPFFARLLPVLKDLELDFEIICVNDGSQDKTLERLQAARELESRIRILDLSRNFGKEAALTCGLDHTRGQAVIPIDADLQDPPELIVDMVHMWQQGCEVVLAQRTDRSSDNWLKRKTAEWFYRLHNAISRPTIIPNVGDFRLMDRKVVEALKMLPERGRFMKGIFSWVGFRQAILPYARDVRKTGKSKFSTWRLWNFAMDGITSFSTVPLRIWTYLGLAIALASFAYGSFIVGRTLIFGRDFPGYASLITVILFFGGVQLIGLGVVGEYIGRIHTETKARPIYVVRERFEDVT
ncbi:glycosyltransferase family 2 protein [Desulfohalobium retbaense]|nr:glycosyltransferase family 2 protein [Desulfohalobium retbaense]